MLTMEQQSERIVLKEHATSAELRTPRTPRKDPAYLSIASILDWELALIGTQARISSCPSNVAVEEQVSLLQQALRGKAANIAAMSLTPRDRLTSCSIILSFPPSEESFESGTTLMRLVPQKANVET